MSAAPSDLVSWAATSLGIDVAGTTVQPVAGDASARRYFRMTAGGRSWMLVDSPPDSQKNAEFLSIRDLLERSGIRVPRLHAADLQRGYLVLEDFGDKLLLPFLDDNSAESAYRPAFQLLERFADIPVAQLNVPAYDDALLAEELGRFGEWFVQALLGHPMTGEERECIAALELRLIANALEQPQVLVHRDFHSRNLMCVDGDALGVIDFQDAVLGPITYDLVSLLKDCYIRWPRPRVRNWALRHREVLRQQGRLDDCDDATFIRWFDLMGLQRHIKVLGTFARLSLRDGKAGYLQDLPLVVGYVEATLADYRSLDPAVAAFDDWFTVTLGPLIAAQSWSAAH